MHSKIGCLVSVMQVCLGVDEEVLLTLGKEQVRNLVLDYRCSALNLSKSIGDERESRPFTLGVNVFGFRVDAEVLDQLISAEVIGSRSDGGYSIWIRMN